MPPGRLHLSEGRGDNTLATMKVAIRTERRRKDEVGIDLVLSSLQCLAMLSFTISLQCVAMLGTMYMFTIHSGPEMGYSAYVWQPTYAGRHTSAISCFRSNTARVHTLWSRAYNYQMIEQFQPLRTSINYSQNIAPDTPITTPPDTRWHVNAGSFPNSLDYAG